jgi:hypothetical protein
MTEVSLFRLYLLRAMYLLIFVGLGSMVWPGLIHHANPWSHMHGVASSLLGALSVIVALGIRYPLQMLPMLLFELHWKSIWLVAIALPLWSANKMDADTNETFTACLVGVVLCLIVIPWPYVWTNYVKKPGDRWK